MTETNELKPCAHCGGTARRWKGIGEDCHVECGDCLARTSWDHKTKVVAAWNRRVVPAQQWTTEPPTEEGYYFVFCQKDGIKVVEVYSSGFVVVNGRSGLHIELFVKKFKPLWYKIPTPPLPTQEDAKDE